MSYLQREPWLSNPDYPHPRGGPVVIDLGVTNRFQIGDQVRSDPWMTKTFGVPERTVVVNTRRVMYHRRQGWVEQVQVAGRAGLTSSDGWSAVGHFEPDGLESPFAYL